MQCAGRGARGSPAVSLVVTPGITIRDRLRVLQTNDPDSYYQSRELVLSDMLADLDRAKIVITNYHAFMRRETLSLSRGGRALLTGRGQEIATRETEGQMLKRVMPDLMGLKRIVVLNDEAHHCYREKPPEEDEEGNLTGDDRKEAETNREAARVWISGLETVQAKLGIAQTIDLSATPFFLRGSGYREGTLFPWTVSDFSLMDAIESGIVKLPRVPVADNIEDGEMPRFRNLWHHIGKKMPKRGRTKGGELDPLDIPTELQTALEALYGHYAKTFELWYERGVEVPPCFIIVCNNTSTSKLVYDFVSGFERKHEDGSTTFEHGRLALFRNYDETGQPLAQPRTLLIDSTQLESGDALDKNFRDAARDEIEQFRREIIARTGDRRQAENLSDQELLREVMNTVGKKDRLGGGTRCVVSVSMLTEGWDANTVTHVLGVRAFGTQLLCEQVIGRALRRQSYHLKRRRRVQRRVRRRARDPLRLHGPARRRSPAAAARDHPGQGDLARARCVRDPVPPRAGLPGRAARGARLRDLRCERDPRAHARHRRPLRHAHRRDHRRGGRPQPRAPRQGARGHPRLSAHEAPPQDQVARPGRRPEAAPLWPTEAHHAPVARRAPRVQWRLRTRPSSSTRASPTPPAIGSREGSWQVTKTSGSASD